MLKEHGTCFRLMSLMVFAIAGGGIAQDMEGPPGFDRLGCRAGSGARANCKLAYVGRLRRLEWFRR